jgi:hypothetical protein
MKHKPWLEHLGVKGDLEARMRCDGTNLWFEIRNVGTMKWQKLARRVNRQWVSLKKGTKVTMIEESILLPRKDDDQSSLS